MPKKITLDDMTEHLFEMAERLLDTDDVCNTPENTAAEIERARAMVEIAEQVISIKDVENRQKETEIKAMEVAHKCGLFYKPSNMNLTVDNKRLPGKSGIKVGTYGEYED